MKKLLGLAVFLTVAQVAHAANIEAGKDLAGKVCAACHGANGASVSDGLPNLAAQRASYLETQLKLYKDGTRKAPGAANSTLTMQAIAAQLSPDDIANAAAYYASLPGAAPGAKSAFLPNLAKTGVTFPEGYKETFTKYYTINFPAAKQVRYYYANKVAVAAAKLDIRSPALPRRGLTLGCPAQAAWNAFEYASLEQFIGQCQRYCRSPAGPNPEPTEGREGPPR